MEYNWNLGTAIERNQNVSCLYSNKSKFFSNLVTCLTLSHKRLKVIYKKPFDTMENENYDKKKKYKLNSMIIKKKEKSSQRSTGLPVLPCH